MNNNRIKVKINSCYGFGLTREDQSRFGSEDGMAMDVEPGTTIENLLHEMPFIGPPEEWNDIMLHVFVNGRVMGFDHVIEPGDVLDLHIPCSGG